MWRGDITQGETECQQMHKTGRFCAPHPCLSPSQPSRALPKHAICTTKLTPCDKESMTREGSVLWET